MSPTHVTLRTSLIVPTFSQESSRIINMLIALLNTQTLENLDLIVINNNAFPLEIKTSFSKGKCIILNGKKNLWSAGGFYLGMQYAYNAWYDVYILWDDDAVLVDDTALAMLVESIQVAPTTAFQLTWKERKDMWISTSAAYSCYGAFSHQVLVEYGVYSPWFFYGGEDATYEWKLRKGGIKFQCLNPMFSHPVKRWLTLSRGSSGLSAFRHNSILQHLYSIFRGTDWGLKIRPLVVGYIYTTFLYFGLLWFTPYFRSQMLYNLRNILCYLPPILLPESCAYFYPKYREASWDQQFLCIHRMDAVCIGETGVISGQLSGAKNIVLDTWFPVSEIWWRSWIKLLIWATNIYLLHGFQGDHTLQVKLLFSVKNGVMKAIAGIGMLITLPVLCILAGITYVLLLLKYGLVACLLLWKEKSFYERYTDTPIVITSK